MVYGVSDGSDRTAATRVLTANAHRPFLPRRALLADVAGRLGLAATLTCVGLLFLYAGRMLERRAVSGPWAGALRYAPAAAAVVVTASGVMIAARALLELQRI